MSQPEETDILDSVKKLKSTIDSCQVENYRLMNILRNVKVSKADSLSSLQAQFSGACGDASDVNRNTRSGRTTHLAVRLTHKEYLSMLIKKASEENLKLRESNVKLKQESKVQDQKIRDLSHKMKQYERNLHERELQKVQIDDLKTSIDKKNGEIRRMRQNLDDVKVLLVKEQNKAKDIKERNRSSALKSKMSREIKSKVESLLLQLDLLLKDQDQANPIICYSDSYFNKVQTVLNKLVFMKSKMTKRDPKADVENSIGSSDLSESEIPCSKTERGTQVSDVDGRTGNSNLLAAFAKSEIKMDNNFCQNEYSFNCVAALKGKRARNKSV